MDDPFRVAEWYAGMTSTPQGIAPGITLTFTDEDGKVSVDFSNAEEAQEIWDAFLVGKIKTTASVLQDRAMKPLPEHVAAQIAKEDDERQGRQR